MKLFNERGFHNTPTSLIAKKSKVSVGTLFNYYPTKDQLILAIYLDIQIHSKQVYLELVKDFESNHDKLLSMWTAVIDWAITNPNEFEYLELFTHSTFRKLLVEQRVMGSFTKFRETILKAISPNTICLKYPEFSMYYIDNAIHATSNFIITNDVEDIENFTKSSFELLWFGFSQKSRFTNDKFKNI